MSRAADDWNHSPLTRAEANAYVVVVDLESVDASAWPTEGRRALAGARRSARILHRNLARLVEVESTTEGADHAI